MLKKKFLVDIANRNSSTNSNDFYHAATMDMIEKKRDEIEPEVVPKIQPSPPSKAVSTCSGDMSEKIDDGKLVMMSQPPATPPKPMKSQENLLSVEKSPSMKQLPIPVENNQHHHTAAAAATMEKSMYSSVNLLTDRNMHGMYSRKPNESCFSANVKLGLIQLVLSILLSAFGGLLIAKQASLSMLGSGVWSGIFAGICGALGLFNIQPLMNGFLACSLISIATSTTALAFTGIGLVRDYNFSQSDPVSLSLAAARFETNKKFNFVFSHSDYNLFFKCQFEICFYWFYFIWSCVFNVSVFFVGSRASCLCCFGTDLTFGAASLHEPLLRLLLGSWTLFKVSKKFFYKYYFKRNWRYSIRHGVVKCVFLDWKKKKKLYQNNGTSHER